MPSELTLPPTPATIAYCRAARRVRAANRTPSARFRSLAALAAHHDQSAEREPDQSLNDSTVFDRPARTRAKFVELSNGAEELFSRASVAHPAPRRIKASVNRICPASESGKFESSLTARHFLALAGFEVARDQILGYSARQKLLRRAADAGIGRFEANLLIALAQHRRSESSLRPSSRPSNPRHPFFSSLAAPLAILLAGEIAALLLLWHGA